MTKLEQKARYIRQQVLELIVSAKKGHIGSSFSCVDILVALYYNIMKLDDKFILSKGHASVALYAILADLGYFPMSELETFYQDGGLEGHPNIKTSGIDATTGSLGHGLGIGVGLALSGKNVYVLLGDGECYEGAVWEAAMFASYNKLNNLTAIIDYNKLSTLDSTESLEPLALKWRAFGWEVREADGHNFDELKYSLNTFRPGNGKPILVIAHTIKGKGVSFMENNYKWHNRIPDEEESKLARGELGGY